MEQLTISQFLSSLEEQQKNDEKWDNAIGTNALLIANVYDEVISSTPKTGDNREVAAAKCPGCSNTDCRFMLTHDIERSTIRIVARYAGSGNDMECLCCGSKFKFNINKGFLANYPLLNYTYIPLSWVRDVLKVDIKKYVN